jgi:hypothetical protein
MVNKEIQFFPPRKEAWQMGDEGSSFCVYVHVKEREKSR